MNLVRRMWAFIVTLLLTVPCFAYEQNGWVYPDPAERIAAGFKLLGLLLLCGLVFAAACFIAWCVIMCFFKLFEKLGGKAEHFTAACATLLGLYYLGSKSMKRRGR